MESIINLVWLGSQHNQNVISNIRSVDPDTKIILSNSEEDLFPAWRKTYNKFAVTYQMKSDLIRLSLLRKFGGIYTDFDCCILTPIKNIIKDWTTLTLPTLGNSTFFMGDIIYCPNNWPYWHLIDNYVENFYTEKPTQISFGHFLFASLPRSIVQPVCNPAKFPSCPREMSSQCQIRRYPN